MRGARRTESGPSPGIWLNVKKIKIEERAMKRNLNDGGLGVGLADNGDGRGNLHL